MSRWTEAAKANRQRFRRKQHAILEWTQAQPGLFTAGQVAEAFKMSIRHVYRHMACLRPWLRSQAGVGYVARKEPCYGRT